MSAKEQHVAQIFERTKRIIDQARQQCLVWEHHLPPKLILHGIPPPPWLFNSLPSHSKPKDSNIQFGVPRDCTLYNNLGVQYPIGLQFHNEKKDCNTGDGLSNLPDCSVNNDGCRTIEPTVSDSYQDPPVSLAKLQRSKSRQRALELRNSANPPQCRSGYDNAAAAVACAGKVTASASLTLQADQSDSVKDFHSNIEKCSMEEEEEEEEEENVTRGDCLTHYHKGLKKSGSSGQARYNSELLKLDSTLDRGKEVEVCDFMQPPAHVELTDLSKASDHNNGSRGNNAKDGEFCNNKQDSNFHDSTELLIGSCLSPGDDFLFTGGSVKYIDKSVQSPQPLVSQHSKDPVVSIVGSQKDPDIYSTKANKHLSGSEQVSITSDSKSENHIEVRSKSLGSNFCEQSANRSQSASKKSQNVHLTELDTTRLSSSQKHAKLNTEIAVNSAEENIIEATASRNSRAVTVCTTEESLKPVNSSKLDDRSVLANSLCIETTVAEKLLDAIENILSDAKPAHNLEGGTGAKVVADFESVVQKDHSCSVGPKIGLDVSVIRLPSDSVKSVMPKQLDFDVAEELSGILSPDMKEGQQCTLPEGEPLNLLEPVNLLDQEAALVCQGERNSSGKMHLLETQGTLIREEGPRMEYCATTHFKEADVARKALNAMSPKNELPMFQKELFIPASALMNRSSTSQVAVKNSSGSLSNEVMASKFVSVYGKLENDETSTKLADVFSAAVTGHGLDNYTDETVTNFTVGFPSLALMDEMNVGSTHQVPNSIFLCQNGDLSRQKRATDGKNTGFATNSQNFKSCLGSFTYDVQHSYPQHKRRKIEIETEEFLPSSSNLKKQVDSIDQRSISRNLSTEDENHEVVLEVQHLTFSQEDGVGLQNVTNSPMEEMQDIRQCQTMEESSLKVRKEEKLNMDKRDSSTDTLFLAEANPSVFNVDSTMGCIIDGKVELWQLQASCEQGSAEHVTHVERSTSSRRICPGGNAKFSGFSSVSPGIQCLDLIGSNDTAPEFEGFIMQTDNAEPCTAGDQMELEKMNLLSNSIDCTSLVKSRLMNSPLCYSSAPDKLHNIADFHQSLPNGLLEGTGLRNSLPLMDGIARSLSDCLPNCKGQYTPSVQTIWDRINSNFGSSGKRQSLKLELPCITEENENVDEIPETLQKSTGSEGMTKSISREPLAEIINNSNPSTSVFQDNMLSNGRVDLVNTEFINFTGTHNKVKKKSGKQNGYRRFTRKGKENQSISLGEYGAKRTTESVCNRSSRPKLSGKHNMKQGQTYSEGKSERNNIVSNITSFIPLVQQKQAAAVFTGKRDIKVKALEAAEAAKRMAEKKENERKMKKEALRLERERMEQQNLRQLELQKKKKDEERKKKEAEVAAKKRQREEEKKEKERKRKLVNDVKKQQQEHERKYAKKEETETHCRATAEEVQESKKFMDDRENHKKLQLQDKREGNAEKISDSEPLTIMDSTNDKTKETCLEYSEAVNDCANNEKVLGNLIEATDLIVENSPQEYDISPYKGSDDEEEDDLPSNKFIPPWASKHRLSLVVSCQKMDPATIFPSQSFCNIAEVLIPRRLML